MSYPIFDQSIALDIVNNMVLMAGWQVEATSHKNFEMGMRIEFSYPAVDSSREYAPTYDVPVQNAGRPQGQAWAAFLLLCDGCTKEQIVFKIIKMQVKIMEHEIREFTRYGNEMDSPFNPHHPATIDLWSEMNGSDPVHDHTFGMA